MGDLAELAKRLKELGPVKVLDVYQAAHIRSIADTSIHFGLYYMLPPEGHTAGDLQKLFDEYKDAGVLHLTYYAQSGIDTNHKPLLPLDRFADKYFSNAKSVLKISAVSKARIDELNALIDEMKQPFDANTFPGIKEVQLTAYKPLVEGSQAMVSLKPFQDDWKLLTSLEEDIKEHLAETNMTRELLVTRHAVRGLQPEIIFTSTEGTTQRGDALLRDIATYLEQHGAANEAVKMAQIAAEAKTAPQEPQDPLAGKPRIPQREQPKQPTPAEIYKNALRTLGATMASMKEFAGMEQTMAGNLLLVQFPKPLIPIGGHFGEEHKKTLKSVYDVTRLSPGLHDGWAGHYSYDKSTRVLSISATSETERPPTGWTTLR